MSTVLNFRALVHERRRARHYQMGRQGFFHGATPVGSVYPVPAPPVNAFPYIFLAYFVIGAVVFVSRRGAAKHVAARSLDDASGLSVEEPAVA